jgi:hypothetical protein
MGNGEVIGFAVADGFAITVPSRGRYQTTHDISELPRIAKWRRSASTRPRKACEPSRRPELSRTRAREHRAASGSRAAARGSDGSDEPPPALAGIPRIEVVAPLEGRPVVRFVCSTYEEELRLRGELERWRQAA